jgi:hypothetical protein
MGLNTYSVPDTQRSMLSCIWIETGNPVQPLACIWIDRNLCALKDDFAQEAEEPEPYLLCA